MERGFYEIKMRNAGRYDLQLPQFKEARFNYLTTDAPWLPFIRAALGADAIVTHFGCMLSFPGSAVQPWHADGPHSDGRHGDWRHGVWRSRGAHARS